MESAFALQVIARNPSAGQTGRNHLPFQIVAID